MSNINIYVMERGFVLIGRPVEKQPDALFEILGDCGTIRRWGTTKGLGELASEGPLEETVIDPEPPFTKIRLTACYRIIPCNEKAWNKWGASK